MYPETYHIVTAMSRSRKPVIQQWKEDVAAWAQMNRTDPNAAAVNAWLPLWQVRPFYTVEELAPLWPALAIATGFTNRWPTVLKSPARLEHELDFHKLPRLSHCRRYFIVERFHHWCHATDSEVMREMQHAFG